MEVDKNLIKHVAELSRLDLSKDELEEFLPQLQEVIQAFDTLQSINTESTTPSFQSVNVRNKLREDLKQDSLSQEQSLANAKNKKDGFFVGPKVS